MILQSSIINLNKNGDFKNFKELRVKLPGSLNIEYRKLFHPDAETQEKLLLGVRRLSYLNKDEVKKKMQIISEFGPKLHEKLTQLKVNGLNFFADKTL